MLDLALWGSHVVEDAPVLRTEGELRGRVRNDDVEGDFADPTHKTTLNELLSRE